MIKYFHLWGSVKRVQNLTQDRAEMWRSDRLRWFSSISTRPRGIGGICQSRGGISSEGSRGLVWAAARPALGGRHTCLRGWRRHAWPTSWWHSQTEGHKTHKDWGTQEAGHCVADRDLTAQIRAGPLTYAHIGPALAAEEVSVVPQQLLVTQPASSAHDTLSQMTH